MGRIGRWLVGCLRVALAPLQEWAQAIREELGGLTGCVGAWGAATTQGLDRVTDQLSRLEGLQAMRGTDQAERAEELLLAVRGQTEALRAWEDVLLGRVTATVEQAAAAMREEAARAVARAHVDGVLARLATPDELAIVEKTVQHMREDGRLEAQRPDLRGKLVNEDIVRQAPGMQYRVADAVRALVYLRLRGDI